MAMIVTEAWTLSELRPGGDCKTMPLKKERFTFPDITEDEVLVEPLYGTWEGNMGHALHRRPIDICKERGELKVVIGNSGVVRVLKTGAAVRSVREGSHCILFCNALPDRRGYPTKIFGYDAPNTVGLLAKRTKVKHDQLIAIPSRSKYSLQQWAAFSLRYITAWANWKVAYACWQTLADVSGPLRTYVWGWGGGVAFAELQLARLQDCEAAMIASTDYRLRAIRQAKLIAVDRRHFQDLSFDARRYAACSEYRAKYQDAERNFLDRVEIETEGQGVSIFIDFIGSPVFRATLNSLGRPGVLTSAGWKDGMKLTSIRALECMNWHMHVHTHYARYDDGCEAVRFAEENGWMPTLHDRTYGWDEIPELADDYDTGRICDYFPIYQVNPC
jgi:NADPH:quinone reductase-like Zn-dependent oxidoreductase